MSAIIIGLVSDTHGLVRPGLAAALSGVSLILHAGDVGGDDVLDALSAVAPVRAVSGNVDAPNHRLEDRIRLNLGGLSIHVSHGDELGSPTPEGLLAHYDDDVIVYGHTHQALVHRAGSRLVINPGAAGPRRFNLKPSIATLTLEHGRSVVRLIQLDT